VELREIFCVSGEPPLNGVAVQVAAAAVEVEEDVVRDFGAVGLERGWGGRD
jgi:hypothetical protein